MLIRYFIYGALGWLMEILWTGANSFLKKDYRLVATTSIWMFFIYGLAVFLEPIYSITGSLPLILRGGVYVLCIFSVEYIIGGLLKKAQACPWDYGGSKYSVNGLIRLDYAPVWFVAGLFFEMVHHVLVNSFTLI